MYTIKPLLDTFCEWIAINSNVEWHICTYSYISKTHYKTYNVF